MEDYVYTPQATWKSAFHGETWYGCPKCDFTFEYFDAEFERDGIKKAEEKGTYICPKCGEKFKIS